MLNEEQGQLKNSHLLEDDSLSSLFDSDFLICSTEPQCIHSQPLSSKGFSHSLVENDSLGSAFAALNQPACKEHQDVNAPDDVTKENGILERVLRNDVMTRHPLQEQQDSRVGTMSESPVMNSGIQDNCNTGCNEFLTDPMDSPLDEMFSFSVGDPYEREPAAIIDDDEMDLSVAGSAIDGIYETGSEWDEMTDATSSPRPIPETEFRSDSHAAPKRHTCAECGGAFIKAADLESHAKQASHKPFACNEPGCSAQYTRPDALTRHRGVHSSTNSYPCVECHRYRGRGAFKRRDHLLQHLKKVHGLSADAVKPKFCSHKSCIYSGAEGPDGRFWGFKSRIEHARHMREAHGEGTNDCDVSGCDRRGKKGFARKRDLEIHREKVHMKSEQSAGPGLMIAVH
ncbi:hypothetical protein NA57DRAFT_57049 [Rhizodiscina lignyota]|uniref:C2H2-type domain-containing protein n=1 Tax=Rhizodiscina lignyota TaxID=1504668 RepID=A0A9P4M4M2_9PEZI|nr:hypothetical protein NA57DRAFT_57049 [Rhizodiscina lignyota]